MKNISVHRLIAAAGLATALLIAPASSAASRGMDLARELNEAFVNVADQASQSVVVIEVSGRVSAIGSDSRYFDMLPEGMRDQLEEFFGNPQRQPRGRQSRERIVQGQGSGVILRADGYILTNNHVVEEGDKIVVRTLKGKEYTATVVGRDPESDIAVLKIDATGLTVARIGNSDKTRVGEFAIAIGAPFALNYSVTVGHVSAKGRRVFSDAVMMDQDFIQTDASINPGNSGGPLVNLDGEVIGINTLIRGSTGIGFAVPINLARQVADSIVEQGKFTRAWLGINIATLSETPEYRDTITGVTEGVVVANILRDGPSAKSKLAPGDVIVAVDGKPVTTVSDLKSEIRLKKIGSDVKVDVVRDGKKLSLVVNPGEFPSDEALAAAPGARPRAAAPEETGVSVSGMRVQTLTPTLAKEYGVTAKSGVIVTEVERGSDAEYAGLQPGDVIGKINATPVASAKEFRSAMKEADIKSGVRLSVSNEAGRRLTILKSGEE